MFRKSRTVSRPRNVGTRRTYAESRLGESLLPLNIDDILLVAV